jgi:hypothetical protein
MSDSWVDSCPEGNGAGVHTCSWLFECKECDRINRSFQRSTVVTYPHRHDSRWTAVYAAALVADWKGAECPSHDVLQLARHVSYAELLADAELEVRLRSQRSV